MVAICIGVPCLCHLRISILLTSWDMLRMLVVSLDMKARRQARQARRQARRPGRPGRQAGSSKHQVY